MGQQVSTLALTTHTLTVTPLFLHPQELLAHLGSALGSGQRTHRKFNFGF